MATEKPSAGTRTASDRDLFSAMYEFQETSLGPLRLFGEAMLTWSTEMGAEVTRFLSDRLREDARTQHEILHCRDPEALQDIQLRFLKKALEDYTAETGRIVELGQSALDRTAGATGKGS